MITPHQPRDSCKSEQNDDQEGEANDNIDNVLYHAIPLCRQHACDDNQEYKHYTLLPWLYKPVAVKPLEVSDDDIASANDNQDARKPGTEGGKKAPIAAKGFVRPIIE